MRFIITTALLCLYSWLCAQQAPVATPEALPEGGFYSGRISVQLLAAEGSIFFTLDGKDPRGKHKQRYTQPIDLARTTVVRACVRHEGRWGPVVSHTYFIDEPSTTLPIVSISLDPNVLFHPIYGLFVSGPNTVDSLWQKPGANFWSKKEVAASVEIFETTGQCVYRSLSGLRLFGGMSRLFPQKSLAIVARRRYGARRIAHRIFGKDGPRKFKYLVLRNAGSDWGKAHFRDALMHSLLEGWDVDRQAERLAIAYINGKYWGIYHLREKINRYFIAAHHEVDKDSIDLLEHRGYRKRGSTYHYLRLLNYLRQRDSLDDAAMAWVASQMEVDNFIDYQIAQIFFDNRDAGGNIKYWRPQQSNGRWRWILYDTDWGFGLHDSTAYQFNTLAFHTEPNGSAWPNPPWSTFLLRKLLTNDGFRQKFVQRFADRLNTSFRTEHMLAKIDSFYRVLLPEMPRHLARWHLNRQRWEEEVARLRTFARLRPQYMWQHLRTYFQLSDPIELQLSTTPGGYIKVNGLVSIPPGQTFDAQYFPNIPLTLQAEPKLGFRFVGWEGLDSQDPILHLLPQQLPTHAIKATFEPYQHPLTGKLFFNEVCPYNPHTNDWIELYNAAAHPIWLDGWILTDKKNRAELPHLVVPANGYLVLARDSVAMAKKHPYIYNLSGSLQFGLNKYSDHLALFDPQGAMVSTTSWQITPMDTAFTLSLMLPWLDAAQPDNWELRPGHGTPCGANSYYLENQIASRQKLWSEVGGAAGVLALALLLLVLRLRGHI